MAIRRPIERPPFGGPRLRVIPGGAAVDDAEVARRLKAGDPAAPALLFDRFGALVDRVLLRILGDGADHDDRVQETFLEVLRTVTSLRDDASFKPWVTTIAVRVARAELRRRRVRRVLSLWRDDELPEVPFDDDHQGRETLRATYKILDALPTEERLAFTLRVIHREELTEVARLCGCSLATAKRRIARAEQRFREAAAAHPLLAARLQPEEER